MSQLRFEDDEQHVSEILRRAMAIESGAGGDRTLLERSAAELGVSPEALARAREQYADDLQAKKDWERFQADRKNSILSSLIPYVVVNAVLSVFDFTQNGKLEFALFVMLFWGIGVGIHMFSVLLTPKAKVQEDFEKYRKKEARRREREERARRRSGRKKTEEEEDEEE